MGKLISVAGNLGAGKTTLTRLLCESGSYIPYWEKPEERPFQADFIGDQRKWALANQMDFLMFRCEQELIARQADEIAVMDGGLDQDFHVFTKNLYHKGLLTQAEFDVCKRFYNLAREFLPPPDIIIRIIVDTPTLLHRRSGRSRKTVDQLFDPQVFTDLEVLLGEWVEHETAIHVIPFDFTQELYFYPSEIEKLINQIGSIL